MIYIQISQLWWEMQVGKRERGSPRAFFSIGWVNEGTLK